MFLDLLKLHFVSKPIKYLVLRCHFVLDLHKLLLEDLLSFFGFSKLFPQYCIRAKLLLQVVNLVIVLLLHDCFFHSLEHSLHPDVILQFKHFVSRLTFAIFQAFHLLKDHLIVIFVTSVAIEWVGNCLCVYTVTSFLQ